MKVKVGGCDYICEDILDEDRPQYNGQVLKSKQIIRVDGQLPKQHQAKVLLHEILHAIDYEWGIFAEMDNDEAERTITQLSCGLAAVMRDNPKVFEVIKKWQNTTST